MATSNSAEVTPSNYQPGGTCIALMGPWISAAKISGIDPSGMGQWPFIKMEGKEAPRIIFVSGYHSCNQNTRLGLATYHNQQIWILMDQGQTNSDPWHQFLEDLISQIQTWHQQHKAILICLDANENITNPTPKGLGWLMAKTDLIDLHYHRYPHRPRPSMYNQGSQTIDICMGSLEFVVAMTAATILPFGIPIHLTGDHRTLVLDFNSSILFRHKPPPSRYLYPQGVNSNVPTTVTWLSKIIGIASDIDWINDRITQIENLTSIQKMDKISLNNIDRDLTGILITADSKCHRFKDYPWSPTLDRAYLEHQYWLLWLSKIKTNDHMLALTKRSRQNYQIWKSNCNYQTQLQTTTSTSALAHNTTWSPNQMQTVP